MNILYKEPNGGKKELIRIVVLLVYGIICALIMWKYSTEHYTEEQMPTRVELMQRAIDETMAGETPDVFSPSWGDSQPTFYLIIPYLAYHIGGITDANMALLVCQNIYALIIYSVLPILCYWLLKRRVLVAIIAPWLAWATWGNQLWQIKKSPYYVLTWGGCLSFLIFCLLIRESRKKYIWTLIFAECIVIALSNFVRTGSILGGVILLICIIFIKEWGKNKEKNLDRWTCLRKSILNYTLIFSIVLMYICSNVLDVWVAAAVCKSNDMYVPKNTHSQPWHSLYIGLGYEENEYGIVYKDECAIDKSREINPQVVYMSEEYDEILKEAYFKQVLSDPIWAFKGYVKKFIACNYLSFAFVFAHGHRKYCILTTLFGIISLVDFIKNKRKCNMLNQKQIWKYALVFVILYLGGMIQGIMAVPNIGYLYGSMAIIGVIMLLVNINILLKCEDLIKTVWRKSRI